MRHPIARKPVASSTSIASIGYDAERQELHVEFASGKVYGYSDITPAEHEALVTAPSIGAHFSKFIRPISSGTLLK